MGLGHGSSDEMRLIEDLFTKKAYNPLIRPVRNLTDLVNVNFGMAMIQLINVVSRFSFHALSIGRSSVGLQVLP